MADEWRVIDRELWRRRQIWADLGRAIGVSPQVMNNWRKANKVPASRLPAIAAHFGWTIEQVMGIAEAPPARPDAEAPALPAAVEPTYTQRAHDIARTFDELKDISVRQMAYTAIHAVLQMAKAGQRPPDEPGSD